MRTKKVKNLFSLIFVILLVITFTNQVNSERSIVDMAGREIEIPEKVERVITTYTPATQFVMALRADERLVSGSSGLPNQKIFSKINPMIEQLPSVGSKNKGVNIESIMELNPDLVIMFPHGDGIETADRLKKMGIATIVINPESFAQIKETIKLLGEALNTKKQAKKVLAQYDKIEDLAKRTKNIAEKKKKKVYFANSELLDTVGENILQTDLIEMAGGINPAKKVKKGFIETSSEELINWNPDQIIVSRFYRENIEKLSEDNKYQSIAAFKDNQIHRIPSNLEPWDYPSPSSALIIPWLAKKLYPARFDDISILDIANNFYKEVYGKRFEDFAGELN